MRPGEVVVGARDSPPGRCECSGTLSVRLNLVKFGSLLHVMKKQLKMFCKICSLEIYNQRHFPDFRIQPPRAVLPKAVQFIFASYLVRNFARVLSGERSPDSDTTQSLIESSQAV